VPTRQFGRQDERERHDQAEREQDAAPAKMIELSSRIMK
jgi:hypothetical protein